jgi:hypothetical protein
VSVALYYVSVSGHSLSGESHSLRMSVHSLSVSVSELLEYRRNSSLVHFWDIFFGYLLVLNIAHAIMHVFVL